MFDYRREGPNNFELVFPWHDVLRDLPHVMQSRGIINIFNKEERMSILLANQIVNEFRVRGRAPKIGGSRCHKISLNEQVKATKR